jgi:hypothetical protein
MLRTCLYFLIFAFSVFANTSLTSKIPLNIWQTSKSLSLSNAALETQQSWIRLNPEFSYSLYDDANIESYIQENWPSDFLDFFRALPIGAMKADLWRYLILASDGGVYSDIDSVCLLPIREWKLSGHTSHRDVLLLDLDCKSSLFCQWTFASTRRHPAMYYLCSYVLKQWQKRGIALKRDGTIDVLATTGPRVFTRAIQSYIGEPHDLAAYKIVKKYFEDKEYQKRLNRLGIFFTHKGFFDGVGAKNLFWNSWDKKP